MNVDNVKNYAEIVQGGDVTPEQFAAGRVALGYGQADLARALKTPLRTVQDWESSKRQKVPGVAAVALGLLIERDARIMAKIKANTAARIAEEYPAGIPSAPDQDEDQDEDQEADV